MKDLEIKGVKVRVTKYKITIYEDKTEIGVEQAEFIATYLRDEGFIEKDEFPIEIIKSEQ